MESKYLKTALILIFVSIFLITAIFVTVLISVNKVSFLKPPVTAVPCSQDQAVSLSEQFVKNTPTYTYDGVAGSVKKMSVTAAENGSVWQLSYYFKCKHPGYGDRSGQVLAEEVTEHSVQITIRACRIVTAIMDKNYDLLSNKLIK
jgi:hypothetical protein